MKTFVTLFEKCENTHLIKDVGQIPYIMHKNYGYDARIVTVKNDAKYFYLKNEVKGLRLEFITKIKLGRISLSIIFYLIKNAKRIDVLHLFHHREPTYIYGMLYKKLNPKGHFYIKSDKGYQDIVSNNGFFDLSKKRHRRRESLFLRTLRVVDTISVENEGSCDFLRKKYPEYKEKFLYLTNALDLDSFYKSVVPLSFDKKENIILTVGRIGAKEKNNQMLLNALEKVDLEDWKVYFIGPIEKNFQANINRFFSNNLNLKESVFFTGEINERKKLLEYYAKSKLFCLTSIEESFGFVMIEAMSYGNYIITTNVSSANDITNNEKYGTIIKNEESLSKIIQKVITEDILNASLSSNIISHTGERYNWNDVLSKLVQRF